MSLPQLRHPGYTIEDWKTWEGRWELIHGLPGEEAVELRGRRGAGIPDR